MSPMVDSRTPSDGDLVLILSFFDEDHATLRSILQRNGWRTAESRTFKEALPLLERASVVLCQKELPDSDWRRVAGMLERLSGAPVLIVISRLADDDLLDEVVRCGGYDLLCGTFRAPEVLRAVSSAYKCHQTEKQVPQDSSCSEPAPCFAH